MAFPQTPMPTFTELQLGGTWVDITPDTRGIDGTSAISTQRGITSSGGAVADRGTCALTLTNAAGKYSARNPRSPYYGLLRRNTPLRAGILADWSWLGVPYATAVTASTPDNAALHITGDLDVRADVELADWRDINQVPITGRWDGASNCSWAISVVDGNAALTWTTGGTPGTERFVIAPLPKVAAGWGRMAIRASLDVNNGSGGHAVTWYSAPTLAGPWVQFGIPAGDPNNPGTTSVFAGTRALEVGTVAGQWSGSIPPTTYRVYGVEVRNSSGTVVAAPDFTALTPGATTWTDSAGRTWTAPTGGVTNRLERFSGEVSSWPPSWDTGGFDVTTPITANGILQRLGQGQQPLDSALKRGTLASSTLRAYWPMEDAAGATQAASALSMGAPLRLNGVTFAADSTLAGSAPLPQLAGAATMSGSVAGGAAGDWGVGMLINLTSVPASFETLLTIACSGGAAAQVQVLVDVAAVRIQTVSADGTVLGFADATPTGVTGGWVILSVRTFTSGGLISYNMALGGTSTFTGLSGAPGSVSAVSASWGADFTGMGIGHLIVGSASSAPLMTAALGNIGVDVPDRIYRIAGDAGIPVSVIGVEDESETLGPEPQDTALAVITDAAAADEGLLYEAREFVGLRYRGLTSLYNQPSALDLPYVADPQPLLAPLGPPTDDDQMLRNVSTITRTNGSSSTVTQTDGPLIPAEVGTYPDTATLNVETDDRTLQHAGWRVHVGTWDEARYPSVTIDLAKNPGLIEAVSRIDTGSRIRITGTLPDWLPPGPLDLLVLGCSETIAQFSWRITFACVPYGPYVVGVIEDPELPARLDTAGSTLAVSASAAATSLVLATTTGPRWCDSITYPSEFPFDLLLGGERVTVTGLAGVVADSYTRTSSSSWGAATTGDTWTTSGGSASDFSVSSGLGRMALGSVNVARWALTPSAYADVNLSVYVSTSALAAGAAQYVALACRAADVNNAYMARLAMNTDQTMTLAIIKRVASTETVLGSYTVPSLTHAAATFYGLRFQVTGSTLRARAWPFAYEEPQGYPLTITDTALTAAGNVGIRSILATSNTNTLPIVASFDGFQQSMPQTAVVTRAVNGISKAQTSGTDVRLADPTYIAL